VTFQQIESGAAGAEAVSQIKELVRGGQLRPGERLPPERELAGELGVSRSTLREAIRALVAMNILVSRHGDGTYVSSLEPELLSQPFSFLLDTGPAFASDLFEARRVLEAACAALAAERITDEEVTELERLALAGQGSAEELIDRDVELHSAVIRATRNPILIRLMDSIGSLALQSRNGSARLPGAERRSRRDHRRIVDALRRRSPEEAAAAMAEHITTVERAVERGRRR
jgi:GntR family transcriptional repressor for pyruvate dehydrogenase complex